jgi:hypothetical protein
MFSTGNATRWIRPSHYAGAAGTLLAPLSLEQIRRVAPAVFAEAPHDSRSDRYAYIPTIRILERMQAEGFVCTKVQQARTRIEGRADFTKHLMTFTHARHAGNAEMAPSVCLLNSHDGSSRYKMLAALIRYACLNGLMVSEGTVGEVSVPHTGDIVGRVLEGSFEVIDGAERAAKVAGDWRQIALRPDERDAFASAAALLRWDGVEQVAPVASGRLLAPRRSEDRATDLWTTFNVVQENLVRGGQKGSERNANGARKSVREIKGIDGNVALNRALWALTERMAGLKTA